MHNSFLNYVANSVVACLVFCELCCLSVIVRICLERLCAESHTIFSCLGLLAVITTYLWGNLVGLAVSHCGRLKTVCFGSLLDCIPVCMSSVDTSFKEENIRNGVLRHEKLLFNTYKYCHCNVAICLNPQNKHMKAKFN